MNASIWRKRICSSEYFPDIELVKEEVKSDGEEITIVDNKEANSECKKWSCYFSFKVSKNE